MSVILVSEPVLAPPFDWVVGGTARCAGFQCGGYGNGTLQARVMVPELNGRDAGRREPRQGQNRRCVGCHHAWLAPSVEVESDGTAQQTPE